jgi:hypothetical protein
MPGLTAIVILLLALALLFSWLIYVPVFMRILKQRDPAQFERAGGEYFFNAASVHVIYLYLLRRGYLASPDAKVRLHGTILTWTFGYTALLAILVGAASALVSWVERMA